MITTKEFEEKSWSEVFSELKDLYNITPMGYGEYMYSNPKSPRSDKLAQFLEDKFVKPYQIIRDYEPELIKDKSDKQKCLDLKKYFRYLTENKDKIVNFYANNDIEDVTPNMLKDAGLGNLDDYSLQLSKLME